MRIKERTDEPQHKFKTGNRSFTTIPDGTYRGRISKVSEIKRDADEAKKIGKKPYFGIRMEFEFVASKYKEFSKPSGVIFFDTDQDGPFIATGSSAYTWTTRITGFKDLSNFNYNEDLTGKECLIKVQTVESKGKNYSNVVEVFSLPKDEKKEEVVAPTEEAIPVRQVNSLPKKVETNTPKDEFTEKAKESPDDDDF